MDIKQQIKRNIFNIPGWRTNKKIIVIESDDWGSIRMPSKLTYKKSLKAGYPVNKAFYERYDALESEEDLTALFDVLLKFKDKDGNPPIITANSLVANPDFEKIEKSNFEEYHFELVTETFKSYPKHANCYKLWHEGMKNKIFQLQFHGREHLNFTHYLSDLKAGKKEARFAHDNRMLGSISRTGIGGNRYVIAMNYNNEADKKLKLESLIQGTEIFKQLHNFSSQSFIAPNYMWCPDFNFSLKRTGIKFFQGSKYQLVPIFNGIKRKKIYHFTGEKNKLDQYYLVRNCFFEPTLTPKINAVENCLKQISTAFFWRKPAIIGSHRVNYVGYIDEQNRRKNLQLFSILISKIIKKWPDVEFISSDQLGLLIENDKKNKR